MTSDRQPATINFMEFRSPTRLCWPDYAKGICIILIVAFLTVEGIFKAGVGTPSTILDTLQNICYAFMVPVFFILSGFFFERSSSRLSTRNALINVRNNLLYPYFLYTIIQTGLMIVTKSGNTEVGWIDFPRYLLYGSMQFWFFHALIIIYTIHILLRATGAPVFLCLIVSLFAFLGISCMGPARWLPLKEFGENYLYFAIGCFMSRFNLGKLTTSRLLAISVLGFSFLLFAVLHGAGYESDLRFVSALAGIAGCLSLSMLLQSTARFGWLMLVGKNSLELFCLHVIFSAGTRSVLLRFGCKNFPAHFVLGISIGIGLSLIVALIDQRYCGFLFRIPKQKTNRSATVPSQTDRIALVEQVR